MLALVMLSAFFACEKNNTNSISSAPVNSNSIQFNDTIKVPITDLGTGTYYGFTGGLYPGGVNTPSGRYAKDLRRFALLIMPRNGTGQIDSAVG